jgi:hypothetical protein
MLGKLAAFVVLEVIFLSGVRAQNRAVPELQKSCRNFAQSFYDWYAPRALKGGAPEALRQKGTLFTTELRQALKRDFDAQDRVNGEIVGIDFDPFLNSQDPDDRYQIGPATVKDNVCIADVYGVTEGKKRPKPDLIAELKFRDGRWLFTNFHYGKGELSDLLATLRRDREHYGSRTEK